MSAGNEYNIIDIFVGGCMSAGDNSIGVLQNSHVPLDVHRGINFTLRQFVHKRWTIEHTKCMQMSSSKVFNVIYLKKQR